ncbi:MAG: HutD family protein [Rhodospirillales bacterium]
MQILRQAGYRSVPWRNGAGQTSEIMVFPEGAAAEDAEWRISMAPVTTDGLFSTFPAIDRILTIIEGAGMELTVGGRPPVLLSDAPFAFPGDAICTARLTRGPIIDLNVMTRRGNWQAVVHHAQHFIPDASASHHLIFAAHGPVTCQVAGETVDLNPRDTLWLSADDTGACTCSGRWLDIRLIAA